MKTRQALGCRWSHSRSAGEVFVCTEHQPATLCRSSSYSEVAAGIIRACYTAYVLSCATKTCVGKEECLMTTKQALNCRWPQSRSEGEVFAGEEPQPASSVPILVVQ